MAIETTPLGFQKPDGNELFKQGDNVIAANAQKSEDLHQNTRTRLGIAEATIAAGGGPGPGLAADPDHPGLYFMSGASPLVEDPAHPGLYLF